MISKFIALFSATLFCFLCSALSVSAQGSEQLGKGDEPIDIIAGENGSFELRANENLLIAKGNPVVTQGDRQLTATVLHIFTSDTEQSSIERIEAMGAVRYRTGLQLITGDNATYNVADGVIVVTGNVVVTRCSNVVRGGRLVLNLETGDTTIEADPNQRRVRGLLFPRTNSGERPEDCDATSSAL